MLKINEPILMQIGTSGPRGKGKNFVSQKVRGQGHTRPTLDLKVW